MVFHSVLSAQPHQIPGLAPAAGVLADLQLDRIIDAVVAGREEYDLKPFLHAPLADENAVIYRQMICRDLERGTLLEDVEAFAGRMREVRILLTNAGRIHYRLQGQELVLAAVERYLSGLAALSEALADVRSRGLRAFRDYLGRYLASEPVRGLLTEAHHLRARLSAIAYSVRISGGHVTVGKAGGEPDYTSEVEATFARFRQGAVKDYRVPFRGSVEMNHVEAMILDRVAGIFPDIFAELAGFCERHAGFQDPLISLFDREVQFYVGYLRHIGPLRRSGLDFTYPVVSATSKDLSATGAFDLALAGMLVTEGKPVVCNDFALSGPERILVVSGPNQGGKTTFARTFGQLHYLACLGLPVPATRARLFLPDRILTHFEREEKHTDLRGKLQDDLVRIHDVLQEATPLSIIILNEIFTSTTLQDAVFLGTRIMERIIEMDLICVCVTFVDELSTIAPTIVSMVSTVDPDDPAVRTFKILRRPADGLAYAQVLARRYGLDYRSLKARISP